MSETHTELKRVDLDALEAALAKALEEAQAMLTALWRRISAGRYGDGNVRRIAFTDEQVAEVYDMIAAIRAAKGQK